MLADHQKRTRADLRIERGQAAQNLAGIEIEAARVHVARAEIAADDGPLLYFAELFGISTDTAMKWFILFVATLLDPLACALLLPASAPGVSWPSAPATSTPSRKTSPRSSTRL
jgi:hypothetical protein